MTDRKIPSLAELNDRIYELEPLNMPSAKDILSVSNEEAKAETLEYERKYRALIDRVRDLSTDAKIAFVKARVPQIRNMVSFTSLTHEMYYTCVSDDALAFILVYRYEHNISIMDDLELEITRKPAEDYISKLNDIEIERRVRARREFRLNHPEEYERQRKIRLEREIARSRECEEDLKKMFGSMTPEEFLNLARGTGKNKEDGAE